MRFLLWSVEDEFAFGVAIVGVDDEDDFLREGGPFVAEAGLDADVAASELIVLVADLIQIVADLLYIDNILTCVKPGGRQQIFHLNEFVESADSLGARFRLRYGIKIRDVITALGMSHQCRKHDCYHDSDSPNVCVYRLSHCLLYTSDAADE